MLIASLTSCSTETPGPPVTTFYHWETRLDPSPTAQNLLDSFACDRLYVKAFDLSISGGELATDAMLEFGDTTGLPTLVPVVFITNEVFSEGANFDPQYLAKRVIQALEQIFPNNYAEVQIDSDWTARTQVRYFGFLEAMKQQKPNIILSCTVRLHQYRDRDKQGIPPVNRGTLMAYNTGNLDDWSTENSIYDSTIVKAYLADQPAYPLPLDLGIAVYDWATVYRRDELAYLINEPDLAQLADTAKFVPSPVYSESPRYYVKQSTYLNGIYLYAGDQLRLEEMRPSSVDNQIRLLQRYVKSFSGQRVMVFRLGSRLWG